ncbi:MAG: ATP phosphoribosyltransferase [Dehalococcoidia bacterium]|nr:ATP phosphoribosyltransferase [Dehalococcoidia bacterium]
MTIRIALPKGRLMPPTADILEKARWGLDDYNDKSRLYRLKSSTRGDISAKIFQERDIPIQVAIGNYDIGICGSDWVAEYTVKYPSCNLVTVRDMGFGEGAVYAAAMPRVMENDEITTRNPAVRIAGEYPNLAHSLALKMRLRRFSIYPLWGSADAYPPENADIVLLSRKNEAEITSLGFVSLGKIVGFRACLIVNRDSLRHKDMSDVLASIDAIIPKVFPHESAGFGQFVNIGATRQCMQPRCELDADTVRLALPDGHQQSHVRKIMDAAGIQIDDYPSAYGNRRPKISLDGFFIKVIRPQDMPMQVAGGDYDLAITGRDWLIDHLHQFPGSPLMQMLDLKYGWVRIVAVVTNETPVSTTAELQQMYSAQGKSCRIAAEYVNIADHYARTNHFDSYRVVPTWGATEAFLPEDADVLIENTETGSTLVKNNLKIIDTLFESTACIIGCTHPDQSPIKAQRMAHFVQLLRGALEAS